jgi:signal transduction histidine kinase
MIGKLRLKLIIVIMGALLLIFGAVITTLNLTVYFNSIRQTRELLSAIAENDGFFFPPRLSPNRPPGRNNINFDDIRARRFFYIKTDNQNNVFEVNYNMMFDFSESEAQEYITGALESNKAGSQIGFFYYQIQEKSYGKIVVFAERRVEMDILSRLTSSSAAVAGISCVFLFLLSILLSRWMVAPVKAAFEKQRRFISDANHELKTPLTIISANLDVLQKEVGDNERFGHIRTQTTRMNNLIQNLLTLSKTESADDGVVYSRFDLSKAALSTALEFESLAFEEGREYEYDIQKDIFYTGDEEKLKSLLTILIDNAIRHSGKGNRIKVSLKSESSKTRLSVYNTGAGISDSERDKVFDRFYRSDSSRARETGGYGLGLSIAKSIVDAHKGRIKAVGEYGKWVEFLVTL